MKNKSPAHKLIQLRRKSQKVALPKAVWDLSNKQNQSSNDPTRSNKSSSKKSSLDKKHHMKKSNSMAQNLLKQYEKQNKKNKNSQQSYTKKSKESSYASVKKAESRQESRSDKMEKNKFMKKISSLSAVDDLKNIASKACSNDFSVNALQQDYAKFFEKIGRTGSGGNEIKMVESHIYMWMEKFQQMRNLIQMLTRDTSKYNGTQQFSQITAEYHDENPLSRLSSQQLQSSDPSYCEYIVDPKEEICYKSLKAEQLKQQLHLNLSKVEQIRRKELQ